MIPFNFPFWLAFKAIAPKIALGNTILMKGADSCPRMSIKLEEIFHEAGWNNNEFQSVFAAPEQLDLILSNDKVQGVNFTGSTKVGQIVAGKAGFNLKRSVMELGGSDPFIVMEDGDVDLAVDLLFKARMSNCGQICFSPKRIIVHESIYNQVINKLKNKLEQLVIGDPMDPKVTLGPLARKDVMTNLLDQFERCEKHGTVNVF